MEDGADEIDWALDESADLVYEWEVSHPDLPDAGEVAIQCFENAFQPVDARDLIFRSLEDFYYLCDWVGDDLSDIKGSEDLQIAINTFAEINVFWWTVYERFPYEWDRGGSLLEKYS